MVRVIMKEKGNLNVWADNTDNTAVYCNNNELQALFMLWLKINGRDCTKALLNDFIKTYNRLNDFYMEAEPDGLTYYTAK